MKFQSDMLLLYAVTEDIREGEEEGLCRKVESALQGGVTMLQLREKGLNKEAFVSLAKRVKSICQAFDVPLIINDSLEVALESRADGVHVGADDLPVSFIRQKVGKNFIIGATAKTVERAKAAQNEGADYLGVGAIFPSPTKKGAIRISAKELKEICSLVTIPVVAIGGIDKDNICKIEGSGAAGVAIVSSLFAAPDIKKAAEELKAESIRILKKGAKPMKSVLTIAGSDSSAGAGIQADIKTITANGVYATSAISALTAQNTLGISGILDVPPDFLAKQIDAVFSDIPPDAVKVGMLPKTLHILVSAKKLGFYGAKNIVVDPVLSSTSGTSLSENDAIGVYKSELFPLAALITPNIPEAERLSGIIIKDEEDMMRSAKKICSECSCAVLIKGGHGAKGANDYLYDGKNERWFYAEKIDNKNTHGTGCTLSSAIAANLAKGYDLFEATELAKKYLTFAISQMLDIGHGRGPIDHAFASWNNEESKPRKDIKQ